MPCYAAFFFSILLDNENRFRIRNKMPPERHFSLYWRIKSAFGMWYNSIMGWRHAAAARNLFILQGGKGMQTRNREQPQVISTMRAG